jgi:hypothetical protein
VASGSEFGDYLPADESPSACYEHTQNRLSSNTLDNP